MENIIHGKILKGVGGLYTVRIADNTSSPTLVRCRARGSFRHSNITPLPGDNVILLPDTNATKTDGENDVGYVIDKIEERSSSLIRPPMANLDLLFVTMAAASPSPILSTVDKLISIAEYNRIEPVVVITKSELDTAEAEKLRGIYSSCGFSCFSLSAAEDCGIEPIDLFIKENLKSGRIGAFAGASGIGKSTLMNRLFPHLELSTSEISRKIERGRHTTRLVELFPLDDSAECGYIADTPGFSMLDFKRFDFFEKEELCSTMREFEPYIGRCRYTKCTHTKEEGCAILEAVRSGEIAKSRHESYLELYEVLKTRKKWETQK
jgi:ribosome biogenesis GTPase